MIGNKFAVDELARNFKKEVTKLQALKKKAQIDELPDDVNLAHDVNPEDFLVAPSEQVDVHGQDLDNKIEEVSSYAKDIPCEKCKTIHECEECPTQKPKEENKAEDMSYLVDKKAQYVLYQLGKIAGNLRSSKKAFAADMVEATALEIKNNTLKKASQKLEVITGLKKMAKESYSTGDRFTGDVISVTIENIKKSN